MNRKIISAILILTLCFALALSANAASKNTFLYDEADLLTTSEETTLIQTLKNVSQTYQAQIIIVTMDSIGTEDIDVFLEDIYDNAGFGYGENHDGVLLLVCMELREYRILSNGFAGVAISEYDIDSIADAIVPDLSAGNYADAFLAFANECNYYLDGYINGFPFDFSATLIFSLVVGLIVGFVTVTIMKAQLKSVRQQSGAKSYVKPGSMQVTVHKDLFLYRNITRIKRETKSNGSGGGGSSRSTGGGSF